MEQQLQVGVGKRCSMHLFSTKEQQVVAKEVKRAMQQSAALVAASLERLQVAEAAWDRDVRLNIKMSVWGSGTLIIVIPVENPPPETKFSVG